jgi:hypothetical protein
MSAPEQNQEPDVQEIIELERQRCAAYISRDVTTLNRLLPEYFMFTRPGGRVLTKVQLLAAIAQVALLFENIDRQYDNVSVYQNTAAASGRDTVRGSYEGQNISGRYHFRTTYVQRGTGWEVVATHSSQLTGELPPISAVGRQEGA